MIFCGGATGGVGGQGRRRTLPWKEVCLWEGRAGGGGEIDM